MPPTFQTYSPVSSFCLHSGGGEWMTADEEKLRVSECKTKLAWALPSVSRLERSSRVAAGAEKLTPPKPRRRNNKIKIYTARFNPTKRIGACRLRVYIYCFTF